MLALFLTAVLVTCTSFLGMLYFMFREKTIGLAMSLLTPLSSGLLLGSVFIQMLPGALSRWNFVLTVPYAAFFAFMGAIVALALARTIWHHHHGEVCDAHTFSYTNLLGEGIQNFMIGAAIASCFSVFAAVGFMVALAVVVHSAAQQLGNFGFLLHGGLSKGKAMGCSLAASSTAILGALLTQFWLLNLGLGPYLVPFVAGWFIYTAVEDIAQKPSGIKARRFSAAHFTLLLLGAIIVEWLSLLLV